jgi:DNA mismatch repair protein MutL
VAVQVDPGAFLRELLGAAAEARAAASGVAALRRRLVTSAACQAAIKINHPLTAPAMQALLDDLYGTRSPTTCPHGRPVLFRLSLEEIERAFRRR